MLCRHCFFVVDDELATRHIPAHGRIYPPSPPFPYPDPCDAGMPCHGIGQLPREHSYRYVRNGRYQYSDGHGPNREYLEHLELMDMDYAFLDTIDAVDANAADFWR